MRDSIQIDKRNKYLELAEEHDLDFLIKCDSDEYLIIDEKAFLNDLKNVMEFEGVKTFPIDFTNGTNTNMKSIRLWKKPFTYRHRQNQGPNISNAQFFGNYGKDDKEISGQFQRWLDIYKRNVNGIRLIHDKSYRTKKRVDWDYVYYNNNPTR
jgi:hypothetical protein